METYLKKLKNSQEKESFLYKDLLSPSILYTTLLISIALGLGMVRSRTFATFHAYIIPALGLMFLFARSPAPSIYILSYIMSSHVLWRMTKARVLWEYSKYAGILLAFLIIVRYIKKVKNFILPLFFLFFLSLSIPLTLNYYGDFPVIRRALSFNLSGPLVFSISVLLFSNIKLKTKQIAFNFLMILSPIISTGTISLYTLLTHTVIFTTTSNPLASGRFGPNQVSAVLGLGALIALLIGINYIETIHNRILIFATGAWLFIQSVLTFSRGGPLNFIISSMVLFWYLLRNKKTRLRVMGGILFLLVIFIILLPRLEKLTQGKLEERFTSLNTTGRTEIALAELELFKTHPLFGIGPGVGIAERSNLLGYFVASHTEYTRLLAEHGLWGIFALVIFLYLLYIPVRYSKSFKQKSQNASLIMWSLFEMAHSATRIAITTYLPGMTYLQPEDTDEEG